MSKHLFGLVVTPHGTAANNRAETEGNITTLQKILWNGEVHTTVSAEAIRFAIRWYWQRKQKSLNRTWNDGEMKNEWQNAEFSKWQDMLDDDVMGFMSAEAAKEEANEAEADTKGSKKKPRGTTRLRRARLEVSRAISLTPFAGDITFNAASRGATPSASSTGKDPVPYGTELHATRYQYGFVLTPEDLHDKGRAKEVVDAIISLSEVAGNHARFLFDFSPDSVIFRWTDDFAPRMLYGFSLNDTGQPCMPEIIRRVEAGDIDPKEVIAGGSILGSDDGKKLRDLGADVTGGVKEAADKLIRRMDEALK